MDNSLLAGILSNDSVCGTVFRGIYSLSADDFTKIRRLIDPSAANIIIINDATPSEMEGHFMTVILSENINYFLDPLAEIIESNFLKKLLLDYCGKNGYERAPFRIQGAGASTCSLYAIYFSKRVIKSDCSISVSDLFSQFSKRDHSENDIMMMKMFKSE